jgi:hypothetical protein
MVEQFVRLSSAGIQSVGGTLGARVDGSKLPALVTAGECDHLDRTQEVRGSNPLSSIPGKAAWLCGKREPFRGPTPVVGHVGAAPPIGG